MKRAMFILAVLVIAAMIAAPVSGATVLQESLKGDSGANVYYGGTYSSAGWTVNADRDALIWHLTGMTQGAVEFDIKGLNGAGSTTLFSIHDRDFGSNIDSQNWDDGWKNVPNKLHFKIKNTNQLFGVFETNSVRPDAWSGDTNTGTYWENDTSLTWDPLATYRFRFEWYASGGVSNGAYGRILRDGVQVLMLDGLSYWPVAGQALHPFSSMEGRFSLRIGHTSRIYDAGPVGATYSNLWAWDTPTGVVPEPSSLMALGVFGAGALGMIRRRIR